MEKKTYSRFWVELCSARKSKHVIEINGQLLQHLYNGFDFKFTLTNKVFCSFTPLLSTGKFI